MSSGFREKYSLPRAVSENSAVPNSEQTFALIFPPPFAE